MGDGKKNKSVADPAPGPIPSQPGEVVWAKIPGYPFWPARIAATTEVSPSIRNLKKSDTPYFVFFFGSHDYAWVKDKQICPWDPKYEGIKKNKTKTFQRGMEELNAWTSQDLSKRILPTYTKESHPSSDEEASAEDSEDEEDDDSENTGGTSSDGSSASKKKSKKKKKKPIYVPLPSPVRSPTFVKEIEDDDDDSLMLSDDSNNITTNVATSGAASSSSSVPKPGNLSGSSDSAQSDSSGSNPKRKKLSSSSFQSYYANMLNKSANSPKFGESSMMEGSFEDSATSFPVTSLGTSEVLNASDSFAPLSSHHAAHSRTASSTNGKANPSSSSSHSASLSAHTSSFSAAASSSTVNPYKARTSSSYGESAPPNLAIEGWEEDELEVISSLYDADEQAMEQVLPVAKPKSKSKSKSRSSIDTDTDTAQPMDEGSDNNNNEDVGEAEKENTEDKRNENELTRTSTALNESLDADDEGDGEEEEEEEEDGEGGRGRASDLLGLSKRERLRRRWLELPLERRRFIRRRYQQRQRRNRLLRKLGLAPPIFLPAKGIFL